MDKRIDQPAGYLRRRGGVIELSIAPTPKAIAPIFFSIIDSIVGPVMVAGTNRGLCWIGIHDSPEYLEAELCRDHPEAKIARDDIEVSKLTRTVTAEINGTAPHFELPLDVRATAFQLAVWRELCAIPRGATRSYGEIARRLGRPEASRAVGHANGSNPLAILIPCHRAIGSNGALTGYRWGLDYKRRLLELEGAPLQRTLSSTHSSRID
jgi:AraC family transcriptional regulator of adaptative response/methylated-DNA-[protein]-cysteine methyltransferase